MKKSVLISGASIAGPTLAYWLNRYGFQVTVVERAAGPRQGGQAIDLRGTARDVVERMGLLGAIEKAHTGVEGMLYLDDSGKRQATLGASVLGDSGGAIAEIEILRGDLVRILIDAATEGIEYLFNDSIATMTQLSGEVRVDFEHAAPRTFDLVIGADGVHSKVRRLAFGEDAAQVRDLGCYVSSFTAPTHLEYDGWERLLSIPGNEKEGGKAVLLYPTRTAGKAKGVFYFSSPPVSYSRKDIATQKALVARAFAGVGWEVPSLLNALETASDFYFDRVMQIQLPTWSKGRVALLGDAAYCASPLSGNGTSLAIVGAYVLAQELASTSEDHTAAFRRYRSTMLEFVKGCQKVADRGGSGLLPGSRFALWFRNFMVRLLPYMPGKSRIFAGIQELANTVKLSPFSPLELQK